MLTYILLTVLLAIYIAKYISARRNYPPGPLPWPLLGNMVTFFMGASTIGAIPLLQKWKKLYGPVYTIWMGPLPMIMICGYEEAQELMVKRGNAFVDRMYMFVVDIVRKGRGILMSNGQEWQEQRRFALHTLRDFGLGKNVMQERVLLELDYRLALLDKELQSEGGKLTWDPHQFVELTVGNIINRILFSERFTEEKEKEFFRIKHSVDQLFESQSILDPMLRDWNKNWPFFRKRYETLKGAEEPVVEFIREQIRQKKLTLETGDSEDFVEAYLTRMKNEDVNSTFDEEALEITLLDLWSAGQETTTATLYWGLAYLIRHPEVLKRLQDELDEATRRNRPVSLSDKTKTPFLNAVIQETFRVSCLLPVNLAREANEDVKIGEYLIPKGVGIGMEMAVIMRDEKHFKNPDEFNPGRFLEGGESEQFVLPFGLGKRACPGESLARAEIYLILGNLVLNYNLEQIEGKVPKMEAKIEMGAMRKPCPYECIVSKRI